MGETHHGCQANGEVNSGRIILSREDGASRVHSMLLTPPPRNVKDRVLKTTTAGSQIKIGLLGGGQLARMLAQAASDIGLQVHVLSEFETDPAALVVRHWHRGSLHDRSAVAAFLRSVDVATFESEFMNASMLSELSGDAGTPIFPAPEVMGVLQDRLTQKRQLVSLALPTADFIEVNFSDPAAGNRLADCLRRWPRGLVLKKRRGGYDGYGTFLARTPDELSAVLAQIAASGETEFIAEELILFSREIAIMVARSRDGSRITLPFVETQQENSRCLWVRGPLSLPDAAAVTSKLEHFLEVIGYVGIMGVEFFETPRGLVINELAPRVHNSAHYSIEGLVRSQFLLHIQAVLGEPLVTPSLVSPAFAMWNLLGTHAREATWSTWPDGVHFHWYQKSANRAGRKMGHLTALGDTPAEALSLLKRARPLFDL